MLGKYSFIPEGGASSVMTLSVEEFETLRLMDMENVSQEQCAQIMGMVRTSVQLLYDSARRKVAQALVVGMEICIEGGNFYVCYAKDVCYGTKGCRRYMVTTQNKDLEGEIQMKIAVTYENGEIFQHFGHTEKFKIYEMSEKSIVNSYVVDTNGSRKDCPQDFTV